jgi:hypothetical protein
MSTISQPYSTQGRTDARRDRTRDVHPRRRISTMKPSRVVPVMGPANRAPGIAIMGASDRSVNLMGGPDAGPRVSVMGPVDRGARLELFSASDRRFVGSLLASAGGDR